MKFVMNRKKFFLYFTLFLSLALYLPTYAQAKKKGGAHRVTAKAVIFSDSTKVKRLYGKNVHTKVVPASTVKVMTALLALEKLSLDKYVSVSKNPTYVEPSKINVRPGEQYKVRELLFAILLKSANDASIVLAEAVSGSEQKFVKLMNSRAKQLGCKHTKFTNSNGLPTKTSQYTTPYDMYLIFRQALKHGFFKTAIEYKYKTITSKAGRKIKLKSHNKLLFKDWNRKIFGKTGYTRAAGPCFVGYVEKKKKNESTRIIAIFKSAPGGYRWIDIKHIISKYGGIRL